MKDAEFELTPVTKEEYEEDVRRAKKKRGTRKRTHLHVDPIEQEYLWKTTGRRIEIINGRIRTITKT